MTTVDLYARIRLQVAIDLARDIKAFRNGDEGRFNRMVNNRGKQVNTLPCHVETIQEILNDERVLLAYPVTCRMLKGWLYNE